MANYALDAVLFEREPGCWVGQCLQYDLGAQAETLPALVYELQRVLVGHLVVAIENGEEPFENLDSAPEEYWQKWRGEGFQLKVETIPFRLPKHQPVPQARFKIAA